MRDRRRCQQQTGVLQDRGACRAVQFARFLARRLDKTVGFAHERLLSEEWIDIVRDRRYEFAPVGTGDWLGKGGMYGQMIAFSPARDTAVAWHGFERKADYAPLLEFIDML